MKRIERILSPFLAVSLVLVLGACGFHLRGTMDIAPSLKTLTVQGNAQSFQRIFRQSLERTGITLSSMAPYTITILSLSESEQLSSTSGGNIVTDYELTATLKWQMNNSYGTVLIPEQTMTQKGTYLRHENSFNASQSAKQELWNDLENNLAANLTRRIASLSEGELKAKAAQAQQQTTVH